MDAQTPFSAGNWSFWNYQRLQADLGIHGTAPVADYTMVGPTLPAHGSMGTSTSEVAMASSIHTGTVVVPGMVLDYSPFSVVPSDNVPSYAYEPFIDRSWQNPLQMDPFTNDPHIHGRRWLNSR